MRDHRTEIDEFEKNLPAILEAASVIYGVPPSSFRNLKQSENFTFEYEREQDQFTLRLSHSRYRSHDELLAELDWIEYLAKKSLAFFNDSNTVNIEELEKIADEYFIGYGEFENIMESTLTIKLEEYLEDGLLNDAEENILFEYKKHFKLTDEQLNTIFILKQFSL